MNTVIVCCLAASSLAAGEPPRYLRPPAREPGNPFDAALSDDVPPPQFDSYQYLGRATHGLHQDTVTFVDQQDATRPTQQDRKESPLWGHTDIEQVQYPLNEPPAALAPDEPNWIAPLLKAPDSVHGPSEPRVSLSEVPADFTSVLGSGDDLGWTTLTARAVIASPRFEALSFRPMFGWHLISEPDSTDLPAQVYDVSLELRMYWPFGERWLGEFALAPGMFTDFENTSGDAVRIVGRGIGYYKCTDALRLAIGLAYLDRQDITLLPLGGVIWTPSPDWRYEIMIPRPRIAHRIWCDGRDERWVYLLGEFGGGSWAIRRAGGADDIVTYRDYRLNVGFEYQYESGCSWRLEAGYAFGRELEFKSAMGNLEPDGTGLVRAAFTF